MKASIFATSLGMVIAGTAAQAAPARIAEFGAAPEITQVVLAKSAKYKAEPVKRKRSRSRSGRSDDGIHPLVGSGDY